MRFLTVVLLVAGVVALPDLAVPAEKSAGSSASKERRPAKPAREAPPAEGQPGRRHEGPLA